MADPARLHGPGTRSRRLVRDEAGIPILSDGSARQRGRWRLDAFGLLAAGGGQRIERRAGLRIMRPCAGKMCAVALLFQRWQQGTQSGANVPYNPQVDGRTPTDIRSAEDWWPQKSTAETSIE